MENDYISIEESNEYAGFGLRLGAFLIDGIIVSVAFYALLAILALVGIGTAAGMDAFESGAEPSPAMIGMMGGFFMFAILGVLVIQWLYFALMESSAKQATLGKMATNIIVTDMHGDRLTFGKATGRYFGKLISGLILYIGYIMAAFTEKKQALHDLMAGTLVVKKRT
jgi:uncharacterized RDD family membrane protein YckC